MGRVLPQFKETKDLNSCAFLKAIPAPLWVLKGSDLGPLLFTIYTTHLSTIICKFNITHHLYTDDTQIYLELDSRNFNSCLTKLANCLEVIQVWMGKNKPEIPSETTESVKDLGVILDDDNSMKRHVANLCCVWYYHLGEIRRVWYLTNEMTVKVANVMISSRVDYCNSLLYHTKKTSIGKLQRIQNICVQSWKFNHVTTLLHKLHWLPIQYCVNLFT